MLFILILMVAKEPLEAFFSTIFGELQFIEQKSSFGRLNPWLYCSSVIVASLFWLFVSYQLGRFRNPELTLERFFEVKLNIWHLLLAVFGLFNLYLHVAGEGMEANVFSFFFMIPLFVFAMLYVAGAVADQQILSGVRAIYGVVTFISVFGFQLLLALYLLDVF